MKTTRWKTLGVVSTMLGLFACGNKGDEELARRFAESNSQLVESKRQITRLEAEVKGLKRQLAEALADPSKIVLKDPEIIELIADIRGSAGGGEIQVGKGDLDPKAASQVVMQGARALQQCYERALKKNSSLQYQAGLQLTLGLTVKATGDVANVSVQPSVDDGLTGCIDGAAKRWKFPKFAGDSVTIEQRIMLTPKT